jgi:ribonuclease HII
LTKHPVLLINALIRDIEINISFPNIFLLPRENIFLLLRLTDGTVMALKSYYYNNLVEAGCDEAGRGCLAGPVFAAAVILPKNYKHSVLNDSKKLSERQRNMLREEIISAAVSWSVASVDNNEIDEINILRASIRAMHLAIDQLRVRPEFLIIDGNRFYSYKNLGHKTIVHGDGLYFSIAAASVLAKTFRDEFMVKIDSEFPQYGWKRNKGYGTELHRRAILEFGISPYHRRSFTLYDRQLSIDF